MMNKVLVTGAAGFIGYFVSRRLLDRGDEVVGIDNLNDYYDPSLKRARLEQLSESAEFRFVKGDISDSGSVQDLFEEHGPERVVHLAAQAGVRYSLTNPHPYVNSNLVGFANILEACRQGSVDHLVFASSSSVYGTNRKLPYSIQDNVDHPVSLYAATKKSNELMAHCYAHLYRLPTTGLRFFTVYGPWGRPDMAYFLFVRAILEERTINVFNHGDMGRDFTYIDDIVEGVVRVLDSPPRLPDAAAPYRIYNSGNDHPESLRELIATIEKALERKAVKNSLPMQPGDVQFTHADISELERDFGYRPETTLENGIARFVEWYKEFYGGDQ